MQDLEQIELEKLGAQYFVEYCDEGEITMWHRHMYEIDSIIIAILNPMISKNITRPPHFVAALTAHLNTFV